MNAPAAIDIENLLHRYGDREALKGLTLSIRRGELFGLLGPNGSGKSTLFRILSTLLRPTSGRVWIFGVPLLERPQQARRRMGVVFQHPSLDPHLTVLENLLHHGNLYGMCGGELKRRALEILERLELGGRSRDMVRELSGGLARRVELAKSLLHRPDLLLLDEPSTGLDPGARRELIRLLRRLSEREGVTVALTTHFMEEAEACDRVAILSEGRLVALDTPAGLKSVLSGDVIIVETADPAALADKIHSRFGISPARIDGSLRIERPRGHELVLELAEAFPNEVRSASFGRPTLEDVFVHFTGRRFWADGAVQEGGAP